MEHLRIAFLIGLFFSSCSKGEDNKIKSDNVEMYLLKFSENIPGLCKINAATAILADTPFVKNEDILFYSKSACELTLTKVACDRIALLPARTNFAMTVDKKVVYYGVNMPLYTSSTCFSSITMHVSNIATGRLTMQLGYPWQGQQNSIKDERNNTTFINALSKQDKLR